MKTVFVALMLSMASGCLKAPPPEPAACSLGDGPALDVSGRADGIYGVENGSVAAQPLVPLAQVQLTDTGVDAASGKRWLHLTLSDEGSKRVAEFTSHPEGRSVAVVAAGAVASHHKIREALLSPQVQVSCCDPSACERLLKLFGRAD